MLHLHMRGQGDTKSRLERVKHETLFFVRLLTFVYRLQNVTTPWDKGRVDGGRRALP